MTIGILTSSTQTAIGHLLNRSSEKLAKSFSRVASGLRVQAPHDDVTASAMAYKFRTQAASLNQSIFNVGTGQDLLDTVLGAYNEQTSILTRMSTLAIQAQSASLANQDLASLDAEFQALTVEIDAIATSTSYNGQSLIKGVHLVSLLSTGVLTANAPATTPYGASALMGIGNNGLLAAGGMTLTYGTNAAHAPFQISYKSTGSNIGQFTLTNVKAGTSEAIATASGVIASGATEAVIFPTSGVTITLNSNFNKGQLAPSNTGAYQGAIQTTNFANYQASSSINPVINTVTGGDVMPNNPGLNDKIFFVGNSFRGNCADSQNPLPSYISLTGGTAGAGGDHCAVNADHGWGSPAFVDLSTPGVKNVTMTRPISVDGGITRVDQFIFSFIQISPLADYSVEVFNCEQFNDTNFSPNLSTINTFSPGAGSAAVKPNTIIVDDGSSTHPQYTFQNDFVQVISVTGDISDINSYTITTNGSDPLGPAGSFKMASPAGGTHDFVSSKAVDCTGIGYKTVTLTRTMGTGDNARTDQIIFSFDLSAAASSGDFKLTTGMRFDLNALRIAAHPANFGVLAHNTMPTSFPVVVNTVTNGANLGDAGSAAANTSGNNIIYLIPLFGASEDTIQHLPTQITVSVPPFTAGDASILTANNGWTYSPTFTTYGGPYTLNLSRSTTLNTGVVRNDICQFCFTLSQGYTLTPDSGTFTINQSSDPTYQKAIQLHNTFTAAAGGTFDVNTRFAAVTSSTANTNLRVIDVIGNISDVTGPTVLAKGGTVGAGYFTLQTRGGLSDATQNFTSAAGSFSGSGWNTVTLTRTVGASTTQRTDKIVFAYNAAVAPNNADFNNTTGAQFNLNELLSQSDRDAITASSAFINRAAVTGGTLAFALNSLGQNDKVKVIGATGDISNIDPTTTLTFSSFSPDAKATLITLTGTNGYSNFTGSMDLTASGGALTGRTLTLTRTDHTSTAASDTLVIQFDLATYANGSETSASITLPQLNLMALNGTLSKSFTFQVGPTPNSYDQISATLTNTHASDLSLGGLDLLTNAHATTAAAAITTALAAVASAHTLAATAQARLESATAVLATSRQGNETAEASLVSVDMAEEMAKMASLQVKIQTGISILARNTQANEDILRLIRGP